MNRDRWLPKCLLLFCGLALTPAVSAAEEPTFEKDVRPILKVYCLDCHGAG
jgi:hypothetical protein